MSDRDLRSRLRAWREAPAPAEGFELLALGSRMGGLDEALDELLAVVVPVWETDPDRRRAQDLLTALQATPPERYLTRAPWLERLGRAGVEEADALRRRWLPALDRLVGRCPAIRAVRSQLCRLAQTPEPLVVVGGSGSGKKLAARVLHELSGRARFETFRSRDIGRGHFNLAQGHALKEQRSSTVFCAYPEDLTPLAEQLDEPEPLWRIVVGLLAEDSAFSGFPQLTLPDLADRGEQDLLALVGHLLERAGFPAVTAARVPERVRASLALRRWPGNVRELQHFVAQATFTAERRGDLRSLWERLAELLGQPAPR